MRQWRKRNKARHSAQFKAWRLANSDYRKSYCLKWARTHKESVARSNKKQFDKNKEARREYNRMRHVKKRAELLPKMMAYYKKRYPHVRQKLIAQTAAYAKSHPEVRRRCHLNWKRNNPEKYRAMNRAKNARRKARMRGADVSCKEVGPLIQRWHFRRTFACYWCNRKFPTTELTIDHIIPVSKLGKHSADNVCPACSGCNSSKKDKLQTDATYRGQMLLC